MDENAVIKGVELRLDTLIAGLTSHLPPGTTTIVVNGVARPVADIIKSAQEANRPYKEKRAARAILRQWGLSKERDRHTALDLLADLKPALATLLGRENVELTHFGFSPQKPAAKLTAEEELERQAKAKATREKHHSTPEKPASGAP